LATVMVRSLAASPREVTSSSDVEETTTVKTAAAHTRQTANRARRVITSCDSGAGDRHALSVPQQIRREDEGVTLYPTFVAG
jgi:hypothetical protein